MMFCRCVVFAASPFPVRSTGTWIQIYKISRFTTRNLTTEVSYVFTCCAKFLDAMVILVHIFLPSWYLDTTLNTLQCLLICHLTFHMLTMFGKKWLNQGQYPERSTGYLKCPGYDYEEYFYQRPLPPLSNNINSQPYSQNTTIQSTYWLQRGWRKQRRARLRSQWWLGVFFWWSLREKGDLKIP